MPFPERAKLPLQGHRAKRAVHEVIAGHKLSTGEEMSTLRVTAPDLEFKDAILSLIGHKEPYWLVPVREAMEGKIAILKTYCYLAFSGEQIIGNITTAESLEEPVGMLQHVFTVPEHRRKGVASFLMQDLLTDFKARKGRALYLGTGYGSEAHRIYLRYGFQDIGEKTGKMRYITRKDFDERYFGGSTAFVSAVGWEHWPGSDALFSTEDGWYAKNYAFGAFGVHGFEGSFINLMLGLREGSVKDAKALISDDAIVGLASLVPDPRWNYGVTILDFFVHPRFLNSAPALIHALSFGAEKVQSFVEAQAKGKSHVLEDCGFKLETKLSEQLRYSGRSLDVLVYSRRP